MTVVVTEVVADVVGVVVSHRKNDEGQSLVSTMNSEHWPKLFLHGPAVPTMHPSHNATSSGIKHRRNPLAHVFAVSFSKLSQSLILSNIHGPKPELQSVQCSGVVVCVVVGVVV